MLERKLECTKKFDLDILVQAGLKRLGVLNLDPRRDEDEKGGNVDSGNNETENFDTNECYAVGYDDEKRGK